MVLRLEHDALLTHNKSMIHVTVRIIEAPRNTDAAKVNPLCQNEIILVPMLRPGMTRRYFVLILLGCRTLAAFDHFHSIHLSHDSLRFKANESAGFRHTR